MKIDPLRPGVAKPYALLTPGVKSLRVRTLDGDTTHQGPRAITSALARLSGHVVYTPSKLRHFTDVSDPTEWCLTTWRGRPVHMEHKPTGVKITSLRGSLNEASDEFEALRLFMEWISQYGVAPASVSSMAWNLLRASLSKSISISFDPVVAEASFYGPRQQVWDTGEYTDMVAIDQKGAYPFAQASQPIALGLREVDASSTLSDECGLARAKVFVPFELPFAPLPVRVAPRAIEFMYHEIKGVWTWRELKAAKELGCKVRVEKSWAPRRTFDLFGPWWEIAKTGRDLPPGASTLAKGTANANWGQFAMRGEERIETHFTGRGAHEYFEIRVPPRRLPHVYAKHIASEIAARVRVKTLREGLYGNAALVAHVDTDGIICHRSSLDTVTLGEGFGDWRLKEIMKVVEIRAPQLYRYRSEDDPVWKYVAAGMNLDGAKKEFSKREKKPTRISYLSEDDVNLPPLKSHQKKERSDYLAEIA